MDSINKNQPEENHRSLSGAEAIKKIKELAEKTHSCFFCTTTANAPFVDSRPMSVQKIDEDGTMWFLSANDSYKNEEIAANPAVHLYFQGSAHSDFLHIYGAASILQDKAIIKELWQPVLKTWFTEGENDPRISVLKVVPVEGYYWDTKHGNAVAGIKMLIGAVIGKTLDDSVEGSLRV